MNSHIIHAYAGELESLGAPNFSAKNNTELFQYITNRLPELAGKAPNALNRIELDFLAKVAWLLRPSIPLEAFQATASLESRGLFSKQPVTPPTPENPPRQ